MTRPSAARALADHLTALHADLHSWRAVAALYPPIVKPGTVCRIAKSRGAWLPKDRKILEALGLRKARVLTPMQLRIETMRQATREALKWRKR